MATDVDICNTALSLLGQDTIVTAINPTPDGSAEAEHCQRFYPIARDMLLEMHSWHFATKRASLSETTNPISHFAFAYTWPGDCLKPLLVLPPESTSDQLGTTDFESEVLADGTRVIYTNMETAVLKYIAKITDTTKFTPSFVNALAYLVSHYLAGPVLKSIEVADAQWKKFYAVFLMSSGLDASARKPGHGRNFTPGHLSARKS